MRGSEQPIHIDYPYVREQQHIAHLAASWIPLEDIHPDAGPLSYFPGSHKPDVCGFFDWGRGSILMEDDSIRTPAEFSAYLDARVRIAGIKELEFCPRRSDALLWHGSLAHGGTRIKNSDLTRRSIVTHYTSLGAYPPLHMRPDAIAEGLCLTQNGGYSFELPWIPRDVRRLSSSAPEYL